MGLGEVCMKRRDALASLAVLSVGAVLGAVFGPPLRGTSPGSAAGLLGHRGGKAAVADVVLRTHENRSVRFYDDLLKGRTVILGFMYSRSSQLCPLQTANLRRVQKLLGNRVGRDLFFYSLTLRPEEDTPDALKDYAHEHNVGPGWLFLTGASEDIELLRRWLGFYDPDPAIDADSSRHVGMILLGNEALQHWTFCPALSEPEEIVNQLNWNVPGRPSRPVSRVLV